ncbi:HAMP domain-containing protein [Vibrio mediterranei]|jgi:methyl-accepting chemotaxis protein|uniref:HAMP domain-containing protein n=1 Tax=Vibrio mediterranei TaxID=689 RepID=A0A3G4VI58_9VIBR|nr:HAMP domain-containing protein [Vibrio mediterranei]AYV23879.1 HAMP domain-containing protein [Vibrio mediterranei]NUW74348.1 HAMP domain-containing protein [Vibrio mediterranei]
MQQFLRLTSITHSFKVGLSRRLIWRVLFIAILSAAINAAQFYFFYSQTLDVLAEQLSFQLLPEEFAAVANSMPSMYQAMSNWLILLLLLQLALATWAGCWLSYRLYGPVERIRQALVDISLGRLTTEVKTRSGDELSDIAENVSDSAARLQVIVLSMKQSLDGLDSSAMTPEQTAHIEMVRSNLDYFETIDVGPSNEAEPSNDFNSER